MGDGFEMHAPVSKPKFIIETGDARAILKTWPDKFANCCVTSPPYFGLRDYGNTNQIGLEKSPDAYVQELVSIFREIKRVLRDDGTLWLNLGDSYNNTGSGGHGTTGGLDKSTLSSPAPLGKTPVKKYVDPSLKPKDLIGIPWRVAFALQADGWYLRQDIIWHKPNPMPESVRDRCTKAHEYVFMFSKKPKYYFDAAAIAEDAIYSGLKNQDASGFKNPQSFKGKHKDGYRSSDKQRGHGRRHAGFNGRWDKMEKSEQCSGKRNKRSVWTIAPKPFKEAHFATFPPALVEPCILAGCPAGGIVIDPFGGAGTTAMVANQHGRNACMIELNPEYAEMARKRIETAMQEPT